MKSFNEIYENLYKENKEELEQLRNNRVKKFIICIVIAVILFALIVKISISLMPYMLVLTIMIIIFSMAFGNVKYKAKFKNAIIKPFVKNIDENLNYYSDRGISPYLYRRGEFEHYDRYDSEDLIEGILDGKYAVSMAEIHTEDESTDSEGHTTTHTLFHGIFGNVECSKNINTRLKIRSDKGILGNLFKGKNKIQMDSAEFEKYFDINADNKIIAMQILTADVMEMMINFREQSKIKYEMTINEDQIYIRFHTGSVFEPNMFKNSLDYSTLKKYFDIINFIFSVSREINKAIEKADI